MVRNGIPRVCFYICSTERNSESFSLPLEFGREFREFASIFVPRNGIPSPFLFRWSVRKGIPRDCFYFLFNGTEFQVLFSSAEGFGTEFRDFLFRGTAGIPSEITICSVYSVFRGIIFCRKFPTLISFLYFILRPYHSVFFCFYFWRNTTREALPIRFFILDLLSIISVVTVLFLFCFTLRGKISKQILLYYLKCIAKLLITLLMFPFKCLPTLTIRSYTKIVFFPPMCPSQSKCSIILSHCFNCVHQEEAICRREWKCWKMK